MTNVALSRIASFSRPSPGTYFDSTGTLMTADVDTPRIDYDPTTRAKRGLLVEEIRTNLLMYSQDFQKTQVWPAQRRTLVPNAIAAPDGTLTATKIVEDSTNGGHYIDQTPTGLDTTKVYTRSIFVKAAERSCVCLQVYCANNTGSYARTVFDTSTGNFSSALATNGVQSYSAIPLPNGWWRVMQSVSFTTVDTSLIVRTMTAADPATFSYLGDGVSGIYVWGAQMEAAPVASSYIPTLSAQVTRAGDTLSVYSMLAWFKPQQGTFYAEYMPTTTGVSESTRKYLLAVGTDWDTTRFAVREASELTTNMPALVTGSGAANQTIAPLTTQTPYTVKKLAIGFDTTSASMSVNGGATQQVSTGYALDASPRLDIGGIGGANQMNGWIRKLQYYPTRQTNAQLQSMTA